MSTHSAELTFYGGTETVTGSNFLLRYGRKNEKGKRKTLLVDCGLFQGSHESEHRNWEPFPFNPLDIDILLVTHAHLDHVGRIPKLVKDGFRGIIYSNTYTKELAEPIMLDSMGLLKRVASRDQIPPLYEEADVIAALALWKTTSYHQTIDLGEGVTAYLKDAGHILGSTMYELTRTGDIGVRTLVFTGDVGNTPALMLRDTEPVTGANYLLMESVYGDREHQPKAERRAKLFRVVEETMHRGGTLLIPAFSLERTQDMLYEFNAAIESGELPHVPIYVDSPLATKITAIYREGSDVFNDEARGRIARGDDLFDFPRLRYVSNAEESGTLEHKAGAKIIIAGSGMSVGGRVLAHEKHFLPDKNNTLLFVGYQSPGSLGRRIQDGAPLVRIDGEDVPIRAHIESIEGYSAHKDSTGLVALAATAAKTLEQIFVVMGEPKTALFLAQRIHNELGLIAEAPQGGTTVELAL